MEVDLREPGRGVLEKEVKDFESVSDRAIGEMCKESYGDCRLKLEPNHIRVKNFAYRDQFCFVLSPSLPEVDGEILSIDDPQFQNVLSRQDRIPLYSSVLAKDSRNQISHGQKIHMPVARRHVKKLYWPLLKESGKKIKRSVLRDVLPMWTELPVLLPSKDSYLCEQNKATPPVDNKLISDHAGDCIEDINRFIETLQLELLEASRDTMEGLYTEKIRHLFNCSMEYIAKKYYRKIDDQEFLNLVEFYKKKKNEVEARYKDEIYLENEQIRQQEDSNRLEGREVEKSDWFQVRKFEKSLKNKQIHSGHDSNKIYLDSSMSGQEDDDTHATSETYEDDLDVNSEDEI
jgi:hypothetical protein